MDNFFDDENKTLPSQNDFQAQVDADFGTDANFSAPAEAPFLAKNRGDFDESDFEVEKASYTKHTFARVMQRRIDGVAVRRYIPELKYPLKKPEKKRIGFTLLGSVILLVLLAAVAYLGYLMYGAIQMAAESINMVSGVLDNELATALTFGLTDIFAGLSAGMPSFLILILLAILICVSSYLGIIVYYFFKLDDCTMQEMAKGPDSRALLIHTSILLGISTIFVGLIVYGLIIGGKVEGSAIAFIVVVAVTETYFTTLLVYLVRTRKKAREEFKALPEEQQRDYIEHIRAFERVKSWLRHAEKIESM